MWKFHRVSGTPRKPTVPGADGDQPPVICSGRGGDGMVKDLKAPVRWLRSHWRDEGIHFYFEFDEDGCRRA